MVHPALLPLMRTPRLPLVDWTDARVDLNWLVRFAERRNLVSARVPSHFNWPLPMISGLLYDAARVSDHRNEWKKEWRIWKEKKIWGTQKWPNKGNRPLLGGGVLRNTIKQLVRCGHCRCRDSTGALQEHNLGSYLLGKAVDVFRFRILQRFTPSAGDKRHSYRPH